MTPRMLRINGETLQTMLDMAQRTGITGEQVIAQLVIDALRTYQWILNHQEAGRVVIALEWADIGVLTESNTIDGEPEALEPLLVQGEIAADDP